MLLTLMAGDAKPVLHSPVGIDGPSGTPEKLGKDTHHEPVASPLVVRA
jgi:hypothetical protein